MKGERYPVPRHRSTSIYKVGLNADTEPNNEIFANYVNNRGEKLMILVGPPHLFETPDDTSI